MKILFVSMPSIHVIRWIENLKDTNHELYWFDILDRGKLETLDSVQQFIGWKKRKIPYIKGEYFLSKKLPALYRRIIPFCETTVNEALENIILEIQPDVIHSFEMQSCSYPILATMKSQPKIMWLYSCWGNDLYYYQRFPFHLEKIKEILKRINFLHTDCQRDYVLAKQFGFLGKHVGVIPGGTGYKLEELESYKMPISDRVVILVKGYEHTLGRGLNIIKVLDSLKNEIQNFEVVIFAAHSSVVDYIKINNLDFKVFDRNALSHLEIMKLMGKSLIYIGNSISDGMPNTLLEAIIMGAFPIQSNPGNVTAEIIVNGKNGLLISDAESIIEIKGLILNIINKKDILEDAFLTNQKIAVERLNYLVNKKKVNKIYNLIGNASRL
ncbi:glycosyltransferase [Flavobacterium bizetiae]|uniref:glycosyltransferase n=1 Tax=Flavobacterium bizetiae TaxID=2704140 RepID=UPI0021E78260|nr:glycosyltransferase [Flavobacterium bizetiae]UTN04606.1 glycosyltransferase [Flavobacterium bizetiae]